MVEEFGKSLRYTWHAQMCQILESGHVNRQNNKKGVRYDI